MQNSPYLDRNRDLATLRKLVSDYELGKTGRSARLAFSRIERTAPRRLAAPAAYLLRAS